MGDCTAELEQEVSVKASEQFEDLQLIHRSQAGDTEESGELVTKYRTKIFNMVCCIVRNENDAWDLAQEAFLKAWRLIDRFQGRSSFYTWLYSITANVTISSSAMLSSTVLSRTNMDWHPTWAAGNCV